MIRKIFVLICSAVISCSFFLCNNSDNIGIIISEIDMEEMAQLNLPDFNLVRERSFSFDSLRTEYVFAREGDSVNVFITVGLYQSEKDAEEIANDYLNDISIGMEEGTHQGVSIGDKFWWWAPGPDFINVANIVFIRKNALFIMSSHEYDELMTLAIKIDSDILKKEFYIKFRN